MKTTKKTRYEKPDITWSNDDDKLESNVIYLLTFNDNEKRMYYVGMTTMNLKQRILSYNHIIPNHFQLVFQAIYKIKHFTVSILCRCSNRNELKSKEEYYTLQYKSNEAEFGYNMSLGYKTSEDSRKKNSSKRKGKPFTQSHLDNLRRSKSIKNSNSIKCKSIPNNIIFESITQCIKYYKDLYSDFYIYSYLDNGRIDEKTGQTFIRIRNNHK